MVSADLSPILLLELLFLKHTSILDAHNTVGCFYNDRVVRRDEHADLCLMRDIAEQVRDVTPRQRIKVASWLVGNEETRLMYERTSQCHSLLLATR